VTNVGTISLDLIIKGQIDEQLDKVKSHIHEAVSKPMEKAGETVKKSMDKTFEGASETVNEFKKQTHAELEEWAKKACSHLVSQAEIAAQEAEKEINKIGKSKVKVQYEKFDVKTVMSEVDSISNNIAEKTSNGIKQAKESITEQISETVEKAKEKLSNFEISADPVKRLKQELENTQEKADLLQKKWQELTEQLDKTNDDNVISQINAIEKQLISLEKSSEKIRQKISDAASTGSNNLKDSAQKATDGIKKTLGGTFKSLKSVAGRALDGIKGKFSKLHGSIGSLEKPVNKLGRSIKNAFRRVFVMAGILALLKAFRSAITNACNGNDEFAKSLNAIKANLNIAFEPIKNTVMPYINALMQGLAKVTQTVAAFINSLFGTTYKKSLNTLKKAQKANKDAAKEAKTYLASFDEMNVAQDTSSSDSGSSDNDSGVDYSAINGDNVKLPDWAERMKDAIRSGDWKGVGSLLAEKINNAVDGINWEAVKSKVNSFMSGLADGLNGFIKTLDWGKMGEALANGINTVFGGIYTFMKKFNWSALGKGIADFLNKAIKKADWGLIGKTLASKWTAIIDTLYAFVTNFDWSAFGVSIGESVNAWFDEIDWAKLGETVSESIQGLLDTLLAFLSEVDWQAIGEDIGEFICGIDWAGIASKVLEVVAKALSAAVEVIGGCFDKLSTPGKVLVGIIGSLTAAFVAYKAALVAISIINKIIDAFKVAKTATEGMTIAQAALNLVMNLNPIALVVAAIAGLVAGLVILWKKCDGFRNFLKAMWSGIKKVCSTIGNFFKDVFSKAWNGIKSVFSKVGGFFAGVWDLIKKPFLKAAEWFKGLFSNVVDGIKFVFNKIVDIVKTPINWIIDGINTLIGGINKISFDIPDWLGGGKFGFDIPEIPKLATGGLATAPTLAMVGDNRNARTDPEVIAPLSKLQGMITDGAGISEIIALLREIVDILKSLDLTFEGKINERTLWKAIVKLYREHKVRTGGALI
jgi:phage-related protein